MKYDKDIFESDHHRERPEDDGQHANEIIVCGRLGEGGGVDIERTGSDISIDHTDGLVCEPQQVPAVEDLFQSGDAQNGPREYGTCLPRLVIARTSQAWVIILSLSLGLLLDTFDTSGSGRGARINAYIVDAIVDSAGAVALGPCSVQRVCSICELDCGHHRFTLVRQGTVRVTGERQAACVKRSRARPAT